MKKVNNGNKLRERMNCVDEIKRKLKCVDEIKKMVDHCLKLEMMQIKWNEPK